MPTMLKDGKPLFDFEFIAADGSGFTFQTLNTVLLNALNQPGFEVALEGQLYPVTFDGAQIADGAMEVSALWNGMPPEIWSGAGE